MEEEMIGWQRGQLGEAFSCRKLLHSPFCMTREMTAESPEESSANVAFINVQSAKLDNTAGSHRTLAREIRLELITQ